MFEPGVALCIRKTTFNMNVTYQKKPHAGAAGQLQTDPATAAATGLSGGAVDMKISDSVEALLSSQERVVEQFYRRLFTKHPELQRHFDDGDLKAQASKVTMALVSIEGHYSHRFPATEHFLKVLGHRHYHNGIRPEDFEKFRDVMLETLEDFHAGEWSSELYQAWTDALNLAISTMMEGYRETYTF